MYSLRSLRVFTILPLLVVAANFTFGSPPPVAAGTVQGSAIAEAAQLQAVHDWPRTNLMPPGCSVSSATHTTVVTLVDAVGKPTQTTLISHDSLLSCPSLGPIATSGTTGNVGAGATTARRTDGRLTFPRFSQTGSNTATGNSGDSAIPRTVGPRAFAQVLSRSPMLGQNCRRLRPLHIGDYQDSKNYYCAPGNPGNSAYALFHVTSGLSMGTLVWTAKIVTHNHGSGNVQVERNGTCSYVYGCDFGDRYDPPKVPGIGYSQVLYAELYWEVGAAFTGGYCL